MIEVSDMYFGGLDMWKFQVKSPSVQFLFKVEKI